MICNDKPSIDDTLLLLYLGLIQFPSHFEDTSCLKKTKHCVLCRTCSPKEVVVPLTVYK